MEEPFTYFDDTYINWVADVSYDFYLQAHVFFLKLNMGRQELNTAWKVKLVVNSENP